MKLHADNLTADDIHDAARRASFAVRLDVHRAVTAVSVARCVQRGSRSRAHAFDVILTGDATHATQSGDGRGASWDQWGLFLAALFAADPSLTVPGVYVDAGHFHWSTVHRYAVGDDGWPYILTGDYHRRHKWEYAGSVATGAYVVHGCSGCDARTRRLTRGHAWEDIAS